MKHLLLFITILFSLSLSAQTNSSTELDSWLDETFKDIDPELYKYYEKHPSGIKEHHTGSDFINIMNKVDFVPTRKECVENVKLFSIMLLSMNADELNQMMLDGDYFSRTYKSKDYYMLYNLTYVPVNQNIWNNYSPYLIILMALDEVIKLY